MAFDFDQLENMGIQLIDGDRGKQYPKQHDFSNAGHCLFLSAKNVTKLGFEFGETTFISKEKDESLRAGKITRGDLVLTTRGTIGNVAYYGEQVPFENIRINSGMMIVRVNQEKWNPKLLYFIFTSPYLKQQIESLTTGSAVPQLPARDLKKFLLPEIPRSYQDRIEFVLSAIDQKIQLNRQANQTLEQMAQALFKSWFVDFDPVIDNALLAGNDIPEPLRARAEMRQALLSSQEEPDQLRALFPSEFEHTELSNSAANAGGWVPKGWGVTEVGKVVENVGGGTPKTKEDTYWVGGTNPFCTPKDMSNLTSKVMLETERHLTEAGVAKISSGVLPIGTVLMSSRAPIGYLAIAETTLSVNQGIIALKPNDKYGSEYLLCWLEANMEEVISRANGSTFLEISKKNFREIPFMEPSDDVVSFFSKIAQGYFKRITLLQKEINQLEKLRDTLLPKLISGELRLPDVESESAEIKLAEA